ncbi:MAG: glycosyltransferase, partial [Candidatus Micrarchaeaceae archaeon]
NSKRYKVLFLYYDPHPFHAKMAKSVGSVFYAAPKLKSESSNMFTGGIDIIKAVIDLPKNYDIYLCEGTYIIPAIAKRFGMLNKNAKIVNILASPMLYYIKTGLIKGLRKRFALSLLKNVDLFVSIGAMEDEFLKEILPTAHSFISYPSINKKLLTKIIKTKTKPDLYNKKIIAVGTHDAYYKGMDIIIEAFRIVKNKYPDTTLEIVGQMENINKYLPKNTDGLIYNGYVDNLLGHMMNSSICVHMGRGDTFPVSTMEAMATGLPTIVSDFTGTKEMVSSVDKGMVLPLDAETLARKIQWYFNLGKAKKIGLSNKFRHAAIKFNNKDYISKFKRNFYEALNDD